MTRKVLITGGTGYIGTAIVPKLARVYPVRVYCSMHFGNAIAWVPNVEFIKGDIRDAIALKQALEGVTDVIHLAGIVTDELAAMNPELARDINIRGMQTLLNLCEDAGVERFIYASSSGVYGTQPLGEIATEETLPKPESAYMQTKLVGEALLWKSTLTGVAVRSATCCGPAPRMRLDTIVNIFSKQAFFDGVIKVNGGDQWRSNVHVQDIARLYQMLLNEPKSIIRGQIFNATCENATASTIAKLVQSVIPCAVYTDKNKPDSRHYRMDATKAFKLLAWYPKRTIVKAVEDNRSWFEMGGVKNPNDDIYYNTARMRPLMESVK